MPACRGPAVIGRCWYAAQLLPSDARRVVRSVVVAGREDDDLCYREDVDETVLVVNTP